MTIEDIRLINMLSLLTAFGGKRKDFAEKADISTAYISQLTTPNLKKRRSMGDEVARKLEASFMKPLGWMDVYHQATDKSVRSGNNTVISNLIESAPAGSALIVDRPTIPVLTDEEVDNWMDYIKKPITKGRMPILSDDIPLTHNTYGYVVRGDFMAGVINDGDEAVINPEIEPISGDTVLASIAGDKLIGKLGIVAGDWLLIPANQQYLTKTVSKPQILGVVVAAIRTNVLLRR